MPEHPTAQLAALAEAARHHAASLGVAIAISSADLERVDRLLVGGAGAGDAAALAACYGAWLGEVAVRELGAEWIALEEPGAPRLRIGREVASPIDALARRLADPLGSPGVVRLFASLRGWAAAAGSAPRDAVLARNREAWSALADHPRFAGAPGPPPGVGAATAALDPWLRAEGVAGREVLCLGAGGGRQGPLLAAAGARVTVVDLCDEQLAHDRRWAAEHGLPLRTVCASLDDLGALAGAAFAVVVQPVCSCYLPDLAPVHAGVARVLRPGGLYVVQHKQPASLQAEALPTAGTGYLVRQPALVGLALPAVEGSEHREARTWEYLHPLATLVGGLCASGFVIESLAEPVLADALAPAGSTGHRSRFLPPYVKLKARRLGGTAAG